MKRNHRQAGRRVSAAVLPQTSPRSSSPSSFVDRDTEGLERPSRLDPARARMSASAARTTSASSRVRTQRLAPLGRADRAGDAAGEAFLARVHRSVPASCRSDKGGDQIRGGLTLRGSSAYRAARQSETKSRVQACRAGPRRPRDRKQCRRSGRRLWGRAGGPCRRNGPR